MTVPEVLKIFRDNDFTITYDYPSNRYSIGRGLQKKQYSPEKVVELIKFYKQTGKIKK